MPKDNIDYSNTIIYKICCKDDTIKDVYVGHTTNFVKRKYTHKNSCNDLKNVVKIYNVIRENGGWDNWDMIEIAKYNCKDSTEARIKENEHYNLLKATLNSSPPYSDKYNLIKKKEYQLSSNNQEKYTQHFSEVHSFCGNSKEQSKIANNFICKKCDYYTSKKSNFDKHLTTYKHKNTISGNLEIASSLDYENEYYICKNCKQSFKTNSGLWKHSKKCNKKNDKTQILLEMIKKDENVKEYLMQQNKELISQLSEQNKTLMEQNTKLIEITQINNKIGTINNNNNNNINSNSNNNNKFNINVFLNETCKDALNLTDFVNQISLSISDLEETGKLGYAEGISKVFINNLDGIDFTKRPIHCSDSKREILYIKDDDQWVKENETKDKLTNAIKIVANKNIKQIPEWQKANPEYNNPDSKQNDKYMKMLCEVMSGSSKEEQQRNYNKIIKRISKEVIIDKSLL